MLVKHHFFLIYFLFVLIHGYSQKTEEDRHSTIDYQQAIELFRFQKYNDARQLFERYNDQLMLENKVSDANSKYFIVKCAIEMEHGDVAFLAYRFVEEFPTHTGVTDVNMSMGNMYFNQKRYRQAIEFYKKIEENELEEELTIELTFKLGYSYYMVNKIEEAEMLFSKLKTMDSRYSPTAKYYSSHIAYNDKRYDAALSGFIDLQTNPGFAKIVPYYIAQCYYFLERYDELIEYAKPMLDSLVDSRKTEVTRLLADAYFKKMDYANSLPLMERYIDQSDIVLSQDDQYQAGFCYYKTGKIKEAITMFEKTAVENNRIGQLSAYMLGDCYLKYSDKPRARFAFAQASRLDFDTLVKEDALYHYAVVTYELSYSPFNEAIKALTEYLEKYPGSKRSEKAYQFLVNVFLNTRNYSDALYYIDRIKDKDQNTKKAYQKISFFRGLELLNQSKIEESIELFHQSMAYSEFDLSIKARANYWLGECYYLSDDYDRAGRYYGQFANSPDLKQLPEYPVVYYNLAYCEFKQKKYSESENWFQLYLSKTLKEKSNLIADAYNRMGDCNFLKPDYTKAISFYNQSAELGLSDKDYALYHKGICYGLLGNHELKSTILNQLIVSDITSLFRDDAMFEAGKSMVVLQNDQKAIAYFNDLINQYPQSVLIANAYLQLGLIYVNSEQNEKAIEMYKKVVETYQNSPEARSALAGIKNIYLLQNKLESYLAYAQTLGDFGNISKSEKDSLNYFIAEKLYMSGDCNQSLPIFEKYINEYSQGSFLVNAYFYKSLCEFKLKKYNEAVLSSQYVLGLPWGSFSEISLVTIIRSRKMLNMDSLNFSDLQKLEKLSGSKENKNMAVNELLRLYYLKNDYSKTLEYSDKALMIENLSPDIVRTTKYIKMKSLIGLSNWSEAKKIAIELSKQLRTSEGAESRYLLIQYLYDEKKMDESEKEILNFADSNTPHQYWVAKSFILLAKIYESRNDIFQAVSTLQSILDHYENKTDGITDETYLLLEKIKK